MNDEEIYLLFLAGMTPGEIEKRYKVDAYAVISEGAYTSSLVMAVDHQKIKDQYFSGHSIRQISDSLKIKETDIVAVLKANHVTLRPGSVEDINLKEAKKLYQDGNSYSVMANAFGVSVSTMKRALKDQKLVTREADKKLHRVDEYTFDMIDSAEKAYWLGALFGTGTMSIDLDKLSMTTIERHQKWLASFGDFVAYTGPIRYNYDWRTIEIVSRHMCQRLILTGFMPYSHSHDAPRNIADGHKRFFLRGLADGNGFYGKGWTDIYNSYDVCWWIADEFGGTNIEPHNRQYKVRITDSLKDVNLYDR